MSIFLNSLSSQKVLSAFSGIRSVSQEAFEDFEDGGTP